MRELKLDTLKNGLPGLTEMMGAYFLEAAIVALTKNGHQSGTILKVKGDFKESFQLKWSSALDKPTLGSWKNEQKVAELGAVAISLLLLLELTDYNGFEESGSGTGIDYWLSNAESEDHPFHNQRKARLEISGILKASRNNDIAARIRLKKRQVKLSDHTNLPAYIAIVEFGEPKSKIIKQ
ncbi:MAG: hypothetical protein AAB316_08220 [Bacteroidota bacterium]